MLNNDNISFSINYDICETNDDICQTNDDICETNDVVDKKYYEIFNCIKNNTNNTNNTNKQICGNFGFPSEILAQKLNYEINYTVKELLIICEYYGIAKNIRIIKCNKTEIIDILVIYENDIINNYIVVKRKEMWFYINELKNDKFMKKYLLW